MRSIGRSCYAGTDRRYGRAFPNADYGGRFFRWLFSDDAGSYNSWGNCAAMGVSPVGFALETVEDVLAEAARSAAVTHDHPDGIKGAPLWRLNEVLLDAALESILLRGDAASILLFRRVIRICRRNASAPWTSSACSPASATASTAITVGRMAIPTSSRPTTVVRPTAVTPLISTRASLETRTFISDWLGEPGGGNPPAPSMSSLQPEIPLCPAPPRGFLRPGKITN